MWCEMNVLRHTTIGVNIRFPENSEFTGESYWQNFLVTVTKRRKRHSFFTPLLVQYLLPILDSTSGSWDLAPPLF